MKVDSFCQRVRQPVKLSAAEVALIRQGVISIETANQISDINDAWHKVCGPVK